jgi:hypothetical protein
MTPTQLKGAKVMTNSEIATNLMMIARAMQKLGDNRDSIVATIAMSYEAMNYRHDEECELRHAPVKLCSCKQ